MFQKQTHRKSEDPPTPQEHFEEAAVVKIRSMHTPGKFREVLVEEAGFANIGGNRVSCSFAQEEGLMGGVVFEKGHIVDPQRQILLGDIKLCRPKKNVRVRSDECVLEGGAPEQVENGTLWATQGSWT